MIQVVYRTVDAANETAKSAAIADIARDATQLMLDDRRYEVIGGLQVGRDTDRTIVLSLTLVRKH